MKELLDWLRCRGLEYADMYRLNGNHAVSIHDRFW